MGTLCVFTELFYARVFIRKTNYLETVGIMSDWLLNGWCTGGATILKSFSYGGTRPVCLSHGSSLFTSSSLEMILESFTYGITEWFLGSKLQNRGWKDWQQCVLLKEPIHAAGHQQAWERAVQQLLLLWGNDGISGAGAVPSVRCTQGHVSH